MQDAALPDCEIERFCHDRQMKRAYGLLLLAAQFATVPAQASVADQPLPLSVRSLLNALGLPPETYAQATEMCKRQATSISGVQGILAVDSGSYNCRSNSPDVGEDQLKPILTIDFLANIPVIKCISFDQAKNYLRDHGWQRVSDQPAGDLLLSALILLMERARSSLWRPIFGTTV